MVDEVTNCPYLDLMEAWWLPLSARPMTSSSRGHVVVVIITAQRPHPSSLVGRGQTKAIS
jgi:hypothetical protein